MIRGLDNFLGEVGTTDAERAEVRRVRRDRRERVGHPARCIDQDFFSWVGTVRLGGIGGRRRWWFCG